MTPSGGLVMLDGAGCGGNTGITFTARNMLFEVNSTITSVRASSRCTIAHRPISSSP